MRLRIRRVVLRVVTSQGVAGADISFPEGLVILRADNTSGKSSVLQGIIYALGLEGVLGPSHDVPFPHALTESIDLGMGRDVTVLESTISLELENHLGDPLTVRRTIKGQQDRHLIETWKGLAISNPHKAFEREDYFVREAGAAQRSRGFHRYLESFLGLDLPMVRRHDGGEVKLYLEAILPLFYVEQKQGWTIIEGKYPTYLGIRQLGARAFEYAANLDAYEIEAARQAVRLEEHQQKARWAANRDELDRLARSIDAVIENLPSGPALDWPPQIPPVVMISFEGKWISIREEIARLKEEWEVLVKAEIPRVEEATAEAQSQLDAALNLVAQLEQLAEVLLYDVEAERSELDSLAVRISAAEEDLQRHKDARRLLELGSSQVAGLDWSHCPTCHQSIGDTLLPQQMESTPMSISDNIAFLEDQYRTFRSMQEESAQVLKRKERALSEVSRKLSAARGDVRALKRTLVSDGRLPSQAAIHRRMRTESRMEELESILVEIEDQLNFFAHASAEWRELQVRKAKLPTGDMSHADRTKLAAFRLAFVDHLSAFGFSSINQSRIELSLDNYRPTVEGVDLQFDLSASDLIRSIWAHRISLLDLARQCSTNHLGLLILDEPGQQEVSSDSFAGLLQRTARAGAEGQQVIIATSQKEEVVKSAVADLKHTLISFEGRIIKAL